MYCWEPQQQSLRELLLLLKDASNQLCPDANLIKQRLISFHDYCPDYNAYLMYILTQLKNTDMNLRMLAGTLLKNNIRNYFNTIPISILDYIKQCCSYALSVPEREINKLVSSIISSIIRCGQLHNWLDIIARLTENLENQSKSIVILSLDTLVTICQDSAQELDQKAFGIQPLQYILPKFIQFYSHPDPHFRLQAIKATSPFITLKSPSLVAQLDLVLSCIYEFTIRDSDPQVHEEFINIITFLFESFPHEIEPYLDATIQYMIHALTDSDDKMKMNACDFWAQYALGRHFQQQLVAYLPQLVEQLVGLMAYSDKELLDIESTTDDSGYCSDMTESDVMDEEFFSEDSLRKCSALALDVLSVSFGETIAPIIIQNLQNDILENEDWLVRESGILAVGAAAEGGISEDQLYKLIPFLLKSLSDPKPLIRSISCWTISRFSGWLVKQHDTNTECRTEYYEPVLFGLLANMLDSNKRVQEAACTAFIVLGEISSSRLVPYIYPILGHSNKAFKFYGRRNRLMLYDALGTLADAVKSELNQSQFIYLLMPPLISNWNELSDKDTDLFPLLECLSNITAALGPGFIQYVNPVLSRCVKLILSTIQEQILADQYPAQYSPPNVEFLIAALDLLSGIVQGLGSKIETLVAQTNPPLVALLTRCIHDPVSEVLKATFALIGDIAIASFRLLEPFLHPIFSELVHILRNQEYMMSVSVYNNALWSLGEMTIRWGMGAKPYVPKLMHALVRLLKSPQYSPAVNENAMIALGRLCFACPETVAPSLHLFIEPWLNKVVEVRDGDEKDSAFRGLCKVIRLNSRDTELKLLLVAIASFKRPSAALNNDFRNVLEEFEGLEDWESVFSQLDDVSKTKISEILQVSS